MTGWREGGRKGERKKEKVGRQRRELYGQKWEVMIENKDGEG